MFTKFLYIIVITLVIFIFIGLFLPRQAHVERSIEIAQPASTVYGILNSYQQFTAWSPWAERDPNALYELSGPESGVGARLAWTGDPRLVGSGWQEIIESQPWSLIRTRVDFDQQGPAESHFRLDEVPGGVKVTWVFDTDLTAGQGFMGGLLTRYFGLFFDRWIGADYELGLAKLKAFAETEAEPVFSRQKIEVVDVPSLDILYVPSVDRHQSADIATALAEGYQEIRLFMVDNGLEESASPMAISRSSSERNVQLDAAIPIFMKPLELNGRLRVGKSPAGQAVRLIHYGSYSQMGRSYEKLAAYMAAHDLPEGQVSWEHYVTEPGTTPENDLITHIYILIGK